jgi:hypothetical protein
MDRLFPDHIQEEEIENFIDELRRVIAVAQKKVGIDPKPNRPKTAIRLPCCVYTSDQRNSRDLLLSIRA